jgi:hypothetical protein
LTSITTPATVIPKTAEKSSKLAVRVLPVEETESAALWSATMMTKASTEPVGVPPPPFDDGGDGGALILPTRAGWLAVLAPRRTVAPLGILRVRPLHCWKRFPKSANLSGRVMAAPARGVPSERQKETALFEPSFQPLAAVHDWAFIGSVYFEEDQ